MNIIKTICAFIHGKIEQAVLSILGFSHLQTVARDNSQFAEAVGARFATVETRFAALESKVNREHAALKADIRRLEAELQKEITEHAYALALLDSLKPGAKAGTATHVLSSQRVKEILSTKGRT